MQADAEANAESDKVKKEMAEAKNMAEMSVYSAEKALKENEAKIPEDLKKSVQDKIDELKKVKDGTDAEAIKKATSDLSTELSKIGEHMMKQEQTAGAAGAEQAAPEGEKVRDADFKEGGAEQK
jgi:molecular chaperone DnaK